MTPIHEERFAQPGTTVTDEIPVASGGYEAYDGPNTDQFEKSSGPKQAPEELKAFPGAKSVKARNSVQGGGHLRDRWEDKTKIYEWDSMHGKVEVYSRKTKQHLGEFCPETGNQTKPPKSSRKLRE